MEGCSRPTIYTIGWEVRSCHACTGSPLRPFPLAQHTCELSLKRTIKSNPERMPRVAGDDKRAPCMKHLVSQPLLSFAA